MIQAHVVVHTHWDREWYLTREQYRLRLAGLIDRVLDRIDQDARFRFFHLDGQTIVLEDYLEVRPENEQRLRRRIAEGRVLVGPWYVMPDMHLVSGEALVRNLALGHRIAEQFGGVMRAGYMPDPFGHVAQMPQMLAGFGLPSAILWRGFGGEKAEYRWQALDGTTVLLLHLPREGYCNLLWPPLQPAAERVGETLRVVERESARSASQAVLLMAGVDHVEPAPALLDLVDELARGGSVSARVSTLPEYAAAVESRLDDSKLALPVVRGELRAGEDYAPLLPGVLSARAYLKQANARVQNLLERRAEPLAAFAWLLGERYPKGELDYAWRTLLQNHPHDSICGCSVDAVHDENVTRFARAEQAAAGAEEQALESIANAVAAPPPGALRFVAVNTDAHDFEGVVCGTLDIPYACEEPGRRVDPERFERPLGFFPKGSAITTITDPDGRSMPFQVLGEEDRLLHFMSRYEPPLGVRARSIGIALVTHVPACALLALDAHFGAAVPASEPMRITAGPRWLENEHLRIDVNGDGTLEVRDKSTGRVLSRALELIDSGDVGDEYNYDAPKNDRAVTSRDAQDVSVALEQARPLIGALRIELALPLPARATADRIGRSSETTRNAVSLRVQLTAGSRRIEVAARVANGAEDHRLRVLFPTGATPAETARADSAFGIVTRPARRPVPERISIESPVSSAPLHTFVDAGDEASGVSLFSDGRMEYEVTDEAAPRLALTLLRCVGWLSRNDLSSRRGHAGPGLATPGAQCLGSHEFRFAFAPRAAPPTEVELYGESRAFLAPPRLFAPAGRHGRLPSRHSFLKIDCDPKQSAVLSALKRAEDRDALVLRFFNAGDEPARARLRTEARAPAAAYSLDLREQRKAALPTRDGWAELTLGPRRIETVELVLERFPQLGHRSEAGP